jgi:hypothetical protein
VIARISRVAFACAAGMLVAAPAAHADVIIKPGEDKYTVKVTMHNPHSHNPSSSSVKGSPVPGTSRPPLLQIEPLRCDDESCIPSKSLGCADPTQRYLELWGLAPDGTWQLVRRGCMVPGDGAPGTITPGMVLSELERVGLPELTVHTNPADKTLVNLDTIFYTGPRTVTKTLKLLGQSVLVEATPASYLWHFGDGESASTDSPGAPYPAMDLTHKYAHAKVTLRPSVDTTYTARFRVNGGPWQDVTGTVTIAGPAIALRVVEATPVLSGNR